MTELRLDKERVDWREVDGELIALDAERATYLAANPAGTLLWRELAKGATETHLAELLVATYEIAPELARADVSRFVADLRVQGLLEAA